MCESKSPINYRFMLKIINCGIFDYVLSMLCTVNVCSRRLCLRKLTDFGDLVGSGAANLASAGFLANAF